MKIGGHPHSHAGCLNFSKIFWLLFYRLKKVAGGMGAAPL